MIWHFIRRMWHRLANFVRRVRCRKRIRQNAANVQVIGSDRPMNHGRIF